MGQIIREYAGDYHPDTNSVCKDVTYVGVSKTLASVLNVSDIKGISTSELGCSGMKADMSNGANSAAAHAIYENMVTYFI